MKPNTRLLLLSLFALSFLFQACGDDEEVSRREMLVGTWTIQSKELTDYTVNVSSLTVNKGDNLPSPLDEYVEQFEAYLDTIANEIFPPNTTITFNGDNTYILTNQASTDPENWTLSTNEEQLTLDLNAADIQSLRFDIQQLTNSSLQVLLTLDETDIDLQEMGGDDLGVDSFVIDYTFNFTK